MSQQTENRLSAALAAKAGGITEGMLRQPRLPERAAEFADYDSDVFRLDPEAEPVDPTGARHRMRPQLVAAAALAAIAAVVLAALVIVGWPAGQRQAPPGKPSTSAEPSSSAPAPTSRPTEPSGYLGQGKTGTRQQVPWAAVGAGWRLLQPDSNAAVPGRSLYLYDPADGRYLITDRLPVGAHLLDWSPDGARALVQTSAAYLQIQLRTGAVVSSATVPEGLIASYTPQGSAMIVVIQIGKNVPGSKRELRRYSMDGTLQQRYLNSARADTASPLYVNGTQMIVSSTAGPPLLLSSADQLIRQYPVPVGQCQALKLWADGFLESCGSDSVAVNSLYVQPLAGGPPRLLTGQAGRSGNGFTDAWALSNGDVLLRNLAGGNGPCVDENYPLLHPDGTLTELRLPADIAPIASIYDVDHDVATFRVGLPACSDLSTPPQPYPLVDYNLVTGQTASLAETNGATLVNYPADHH
jgi:hypothetical protein